MRIIETEIDGSMYVPYHHDVDVYDDVHGGGWIVFGTLVPVALSPMTCILLPPCLLD